jgi:hypothetical protein
MTDGRMARVALALAACGLAVASIAAQKIEIESNKDPNADFKALRTYSWLPSPPAPAHVAPGAVSNPNLTTEVLGPHIIAAADRELTSRGLKRVDEGETDVRVVYYAALNVGMDSAVLGSYYQYTTGWALPLGVGPTTSVRLYERGTIIVDMVSRSTNKAIWRGSMATDVEQGKTLEKRIERINQAMKRVFERFPLPVQKKR